MTDSELKLLYTLHKGMCKQITQGWPHNQIRQISLGVITYPCPRWRFDTQVAPVKHHMITLDDTYMCQLTWSPCVQVMVCRQAIAELLWIRLSGPYLSEIWITIQIDCFKEMHLEMSWIDSLRPSNASNAVWCYRTRSTLVPLMADRWGLVSLKGNFTENSQDIYAWYGFENYWFKIIAANVLRPPSDNTKG